LPKKYRGGAFVGEHGSWGRPVFNGYKVVFVPFRGGRTSTSGADLTDPALRQDTSQHLLKTVHIDRFCEMVVEF
jgi:glucose/arabinose dehydrogenase